MVLRSPRVTMGATLVWPAVAVLGFLLFTGVVVALGTSSTARYEFERNGAGAPQRTAAHSRGTRPAGGRASSRPAAGAPPPAGGVPSSRPAGPADAQARPQAVVLALRPAPAPPASGPTWWL